MKDLRLTKTIDTDPVSRRISQLQVTGDQVKTVIQWQQSVENMIAKGVDTFVEIGPGKTLAGFMKRINKEVRMVNIGSVEDLEKAVELLI